MTPMQPIMRELRARAEASDHLLAWWIPYTTSMQASSRSRSRPGTVQPCMPRPRRSHQTDPVIVLSQVLESNRTAYGQRPTELGWVSSLEWIAWGSSSGINRLIVVCMPASLSVCHGSDGSLLKHVLESWWAWVHHELSLGKLQMRLLSAAAYLTSHLPLRFVPLLNRILIAPLFHGLAGRGGSVFVKEGKEEVEYTPPSPTLC